MNDSQPLRIYIFWNKGFKSFVFHITSLLFLFKNVQKYMQLLKDDFLRFKTLIGAIMRHEIMFYLFISKINSTKLFPI